MKKKIIYKVTTKYSIEIEVENINKKKLIEEYSLFEQSINIDNVNFSYDDNKRILSDIHQCIKKGVKNLGK